MDTHTQLYTFHSPFGRFPQRRVVTQHVAHLPRAER